MAAASTDDATTPPPPATEPPTLATNDSRLSLSDGDRLTISVAMAAAAGMMLGGAHGSKEAVYRFRAMNAHRLPSTQTGWYLYHKSKNYHRSLGGIKEGARMAGRLAAWTTLFVVAEEATDQVRMVMANLRGGDTDDNDGSYVSRDFMSTALAGLCTSGAFSLWSRFPVPTAARMARLGLKVGIGYGLLQDAVGYMRGRRLGYVEFIKRHAFGSRAEESRSTAGVVG